MLVYFLANNGNQIINQGLNLSTEIRVTYHSFENKLYIDDNLNHIENFWGDNISSITALVGSNGAGKSTMLNLLKDRYMYGLAKNTSSILIYKENNHFYLNYTEDLIKSIDISIHDLSLKLEEEDLSSELLSEGVRYPLSNDIFGKYIIIQRFPKLNYPESLKTVNSIQKSTFLAGKTDLIFFTNHWNFTMSARNFIHDTNIKGYGYFDLSIGNRIDSIIKTPYQEVPTIVNIYDEYDLFQDSRFNIDYLNKYKENEIKNTVAFLEKKENFSLLESTFKLPESINIFSDFMGSDKRENYFLYEGEKDFHLRFEDRERNFELENKIYDYLLKDIEDLIPYETILILRSIENLFSDLDLFFKAELFKEPIIDCLKNNNIKLNSKIDILAIIKNMGKNIETTIFSNNDFNTLRKQKKKQINSRIQNLITGYYEFVNFLLSQLDEKIIKKISIEKTFFMNNSARIITVEHPSILIDDNGIAFLNRFFETYNKIGSNNSFLYFTWRGLSSGEASLLSLFTGINNALEESKNKDVIILLDEAEASFHPEWQRQYLELLIKNIGGKAKLVKKEIQIIIATHSPFILSDLPNDCVQYLIKDVQTQQINISSQLDDKPLTFASNIHELYSHSFFLNGGLIGSFAKEKINTVAQKLIDNNQDDRKEDSPSNLTWDDIPKIINTIGEPILRNRLIELYNQKRILNQTVTPIPVQEEISKLKAAIDKIQNKLNQLETGEK